MKSLVLIVLLVATLGFQRCGQISEALEPNAGSKITTCEEVTREQISSYFIIPGVSVGKFRVGDQKEQIKQSMDKCSRSRIVEYPDSSGLEAMISTADSNINTYTVGSGIAAFIKNDRLFQIKVDSFLFSNEEITKNSLIAEVRAKYPDAQLFKLAGSADINESNSADLLYLVDKQKGIAFEFYETRLKYRKVSGIYVFEANTDFFPLGTLNSPESMKLVKV